MQLHTYCIWFHEKQSRGFINFKDQGGLIHLEGSFAVVAPKAGLVEDLVISCELLYQIHFLVTCLTLLGCPSISCHYFLSWSYSKHSFTKSMKTQKISCKIRRELNLFFLFVCKYSSLSLLNLSFHSQVCQRGSIYALPPANNGSYEENTIILMKEDIWSSRVAVRIWGTYVILNNKINYELSTKNI